MKLWRRSNRQQKAPAPVWTTKRVLIFNKPNCQA